MIGKALCSFRRRASGGKLSGAAGEGKPAETDANTSFVWLTVGDTRVASSRVRAYKMSDHLRAIGLESVALRGSGLRGRAMGALVVLVRAPEVVVIQKLLYGRLMLRLLRFRSRHLVFECDDAIQVGYPGGRVREGRRAQRRLRLVVAAADLITTSNRLLAQDFSFGSAPVIYFPGPSPDYLPVPEKDGRTVLWLGSPSTSHHLERLGTLPLTLSTRGIKCVAVGAKPSVRRFGWTVVDWSPSTSEMWLRLATIGVMPLTESYWDARKAGYKILEYASRGVIPVAQRCEGAAALMRGTLEALLVSNDNEWLEAILEALRRRCELRACASLLPKQHSYDAAGAKLIQAIEELG